MKKAVVLLSGGVDSAVTLYLAKKDRDCKALIFDYGQKASKEIDCACELAVKAGCEFYMMNIALPWNGSALLDPNIDIPGGETTEGGAIPSTYVPARNMIFLSYGVSFAEAIGAESVFIGAHQLDYSNYPDCREGFFNSFSEMVAQGTKRGVEGDPVKIITPVLDKTKKEIVEIGKQLEVPFENTWSCYAEGDKPCGTCESCLFRMNAFKDAGVDDPIQPIRESV